MTVTESGDLVPLASIVEMLQDVLDQLDGVDHLLVEHRRAAGEDHHTIARLQATTERVRQAWAATSSAKNALRRR